MRNIKMIIEYDGSRYLGWQRLGDSDKTIQGKLEAVISQMVGVSTEIIGSGRTDAGVHARGQVANFKTESMMSLDEMQSYINHYLPGDIVVKKIFQVDDRFHSRYKVRGKKYIYYVWNHVVPSAFDRKYSYYFPENLDTEKMNEACKLLLGTHDFIAFSSLKKSKKSTVRTIDEISISREGSMLQFSFVGEGFLYNMIRIIMGTLLDIGRGKMALEDIDNIFQSETRSEAGITVPPNGLFLEEVYY